MNDSDLAQRIERLNAIGIALSAERDLQRLLDLILESARTITHADGGTLYLVEEGDKVRMQIMHTASLGLSVRDGGDDRTPLEPIPLYRPDGTPNESTVVSYVVLNGETVNIPDVYAAEGFDFSGPKEFDANTGYRSQSFLTVPMRNNDGDIIAVLQLINAQAPETGETIAFSPASQQLAESLASQAAVALTNRRLIDDLERLFQSFVQLIADTIDHKSPHTGNHCRRVPVITMALADAVHDADFGPFADFQLDRAGRYELETAAWLHDCGKIITPEHVMDKATKLQKVFDRIELIQTRLAVVRAQLEAGASPPGDGGAPITVAELDDISAFLKRVNVGGERMSDADVARVKSIATIQWRDERGRWRPLLGADEVAALTINKGTLTEDERHIINNHIVVTINMLEALPFPKHLRNVPEYAGGHHERVDGNGYPKGLRREQMSVQARIMAIADVFEALTAKDRPYKPGRKLSDTMAIMGRMAAGGHLDPDLFEIFVRGRVYRQYAEQYLEPDLIDAVDEGLLLAGRAG